MMKNKSVDDEGILVNSKRICVDNKEISPEYCILLMKHELDKK